MGKEDQEVDEGVEIKTKRITTTATVMPMVVTLGAVEAEAGEEVDEVEEEEAAEEAAMILSIGLCLITFTTSIVMSNIMLDLAQDCPKKKGIELLNNILLRKEKMSAVRSPETPETMIPEESRSPVPIQSGVEVLVSQKDCYI